MSPMAHSLLSSDLEHRYTSRDGFYKGTRFIDQIEEYGEELAKNLFRSETAELRPLSGHIADLTFLACFTKSKDKVLCVSTEDGGYPGFGENGLSRLLRCRMISFPFSKTNMNIKIEEASDVILREKPVVIIFGASKFLFPHPVQELTKAAREVGSHIIYDGSHVLGLIAGEEFQDPLREGCSVLLGSTHKSFFGPQGGIILADQEYGEVIKERIFPEFVDNAHWNRIAAMTLALIEMKTYGKEYAREIVRNAQTLGKALDDEGCPVACPHLGYTRSHQVLLSYDDPKEGATIAKRLEKANIITDNDVRLGVCEATRRGMKGEEMQKIASFIKRVIVDKENPDRIKREIVNFVKEYQEVKFCFK